MKYIQETSPYYPCHLDVLSDFFDSWQRENPQEVRWSTYRYPPTSCRIHLLWWRRRNKLEPWTRAKNVEVREKRGIVDSLDIITWGWNNRRHAILHLKNSFPKNRFGSEDWTSEMVWDAFPASSDAAIERKVHHQFHLELLRHIWW